MVVDVSGPNIVSTTTATKIRPKVCHFRRWSSSPPAHTAGAPLFVRLLLLLLGVVDDDGRKECPPRAGAIPTTPSSTIRWCVTARDDDDDDALISPPVSGSVRRSVVVVPTCDHTGQHVPTKHAFSRVCECESTNGKTLQAMLIQ